MKALFLMKNINISIILVLSFLYLGCLCISVLGIENMNFQYISRFDFLEFFAAIIFFITIFFGNKNIKFYFILLVFNILALPSNVDNLFPSILLSATTDIKKIYFPIVTHIDIYLIFGIVKFWSKNIFFETDFKDYKVRVFFSTLFLLFISIIVNAIKHYNLYDIGLIFSNSYHLRYLLLLVLLFLNTPIIKHKNEIILGIIISVVFLIVESLVYSYIFSFKTRLTSGTLGYNVFANVLSAITCYFIYLIIRKIVPVKYLILVTITVICIALTKTRSAFFLLIIYLSLESIYLFIYLYKYKLYAKASVFLLLFSVVIYMGTIYLSQNERLFPANFKIEKINLNKERLNDIIVLKNNDFNASLILRMNHFQTSINMVKEEPIFGIGPGRWNRYKNDYGSIDNHVLDSHNDFLAVASQYGLPVSVLLSFNIFLLPLLIFVNKHRKTDLNRNATNYLFIINIVMMFASLTNSGLFKNQVFGFLALLLMLFIFDKLNKEYENSNPWHKGNSK